jgi:sugar phosphate isomerase/epimerase
MLDDASIGAFLNVTDGDLERLRTDVSALAELRLDHLEVWLEYQPTRRELQELSALLDGWVTIMHGPFIGMSLSTEWDGLATISLERCHRAIEAAGVLECQVVTLHGGAYGNFAPHTNALDRLSARVARYARISRPVVTIENMPARGGATREAVATAEDLDGLARRSPELRVTLDVGHCIQNGEDPAAVAARHLSRIENIHLHDGRVGGKAHTALGTGDLALDELVSRLDHDHYAGFVSIETLSRQDLVASLEVLASLDVSPGRRAQRRARRMPQAV